jgi:hypothetical protein
MRLFANWVVYMYIVTRWHAAGSGGVRVLHPVLSTGGAPHKHTHTAHNKNMKIYQYVCFRMFQMASLLTQGSPSGPSVCRAGLGLHLHTKKLRCLSPPKGRLGTPLIMHPVGHN